MSNIVLDEPCKCEQSHDITFCSGERCDKKSTCQGYIRNHSFQKNEHVSVTSFADHDGNCAKYLVKDFPITSRSDE